MLLPVWDKPEPYFQILNKLKPILPPSRSPWRIAPDEKHVPTHKLARTRNCLVTVHPEAITIGSPYGRSRKGLGLFAAVLMFMFSLVLCFFAVQSINLYYEDFFGFFVSSVGAVVVFLAAIWFFNFAVRMQSDWPVMFNKKNRTVTFIRPNRPRFFKFWEFTNSGVATYSWDDVKVRTYKLIVSNAGKSFHESYWMVLLWGELDEHGQTAVKDCVPIGYEGYFEDERLFQVWEHIRRYMEECGPPIQLGEQLRKPVNNRKPMEFPPEVIAAAGGPALSVAEVELLARAGGAAGSESC
uniref:DUF6708 domain-containing protein n=1 Tax=Ralstonia solanacearum CFBP2957 TaxID=859656 RepID=D8P3Y8_RALSL|nr:conserved protein of unknown function [Ralstonia solanacearum CFBP2957]